MGFLKRLFRQREHHQWLPFVENAVLQAIKSPEARTPAAALEVAKAILKTELGCDPVPAAVKAMKTQIRKRF